MRRKKILFWVTALLSVICDRLTKLWVLDHFVLSKPPQTMPVIPGVFHFSYTTNPGAAFSLCVGVGWCEALLPWLSLAVSIGLCCLGLFGPHLPRWEQTGYGFLLGGAAGNGLDRLLMGKVIDFLDFRFIQFPVFNIADVCINIGLACLLIATWKNKPVSSRKFPSD